MEGRPSKLFSLLEDEEVRIAGVGIHADTAKLEREHGVCVTSVVELGRFAAETTGDPTWYKMGLASMASRSVNQNVVNF